jgi:hypothetical protein
LSTITKENEMTNFVNLTPHPITIRKDGIDTTFQPSGKVARVNEMANDVEREIDEYIRTIKSASFDCALNFWKSNQFKLSNLANLAMKYVRIPASYAAVERMFSKAGHIFSLKRRRMGIKIFCGLVFLKLNEMFF